MPGWVLVPNPGNLVQAPPSLPPVCRVGTTLRSTPTPGLWATAWSPLRTQCSDVVRSFSQRQPTRRDRKFQGPPLRPNGHPALVLAGAGPLLWPRTPVSHHLLQGQGLCGKAAPGGRAPSCTPRVPATAAACTSERTGFCDTGGGVCECLYETARPPSCPGWGEGSGEVCT